MFSYFFFLNFQVVEFLVFNYGSDFHMLHFLTLVCHVSFPILGALFQ